MGLMLRVEIHLRSGTVVVVEAEDLITTETATGSFMGFELVYADGAKEGLRYIDREQVVAIKQTELDEGTQAND